MQPFVFVISHLGSDSNRLIATLNTNRTVRIHNLGLAYRHPSDLGKAIENRSLEFTGDHLACIEMLSEHPRNTEVYGDHLCFNASFSCEKLYNECKFVYLVREAKPSINEITCSSQYCYNSRTACRYYCYRLRRICEMAKRTPQAVFLTWESFAAGKGGSEIAKYLELDQSYSFEEFESEALDKVPLRYIEEAQDSYERHLFYAKKLNLVFV